jgi:FkbM family methyltransferase
MLSSLRRTIARGRYTRGAADLARPAYRALRTQWLRLRYPRGGFVSGNGVNVFVDFQSPTYAWYDADAPNLAFDKRVIASLIEQSEGNVFFDVGAHYGFYAAFLAQALSTRAGARVIAFEPDAKSFACLEQTVAASRGSVDVTAMRMAVGDFDGDVTLHRAAGAACAHTYSDVSSSSFDTAPIRRLDTLATELLRDGDRIAFMKVDIDGAEPSLLRGATATLEQHRPLVFMEFGPPGLRAAGADPRELFTRLCAAFHTYWVIFDRGVVRAVTAADYGELEQHVGDRVTDLVLSHRPLSFPNFA